MKRFFSISLIFLSILLVVSAGLAAAADKVKLIVGGDHQNPPYEFLQNGTPAGFNIDLVRAAAEVTGLDIDVRLGPWSKVRTLLEEGKIDALAGMYWSEKRNRRVDFSVPHTMVSAGLCVREGSPICSVEDLKGKEVIVQKGDVIDDYLRDTGVAARIIEVTDPADVLRLLASGMHDCALMPSRYQGEYLKSSLGLANVEVLNSDLPQFRYCFAVRKGNGALLYRLDEGLNILKVNGRYKEIYEKWFGVYEKKDLWQSLRYFVWALAGIVALLAASFIWSWFLRREVRLRTAKLRESEEKFRVLAETSPAGIFLYQGEHIVYVNHAMVNMLGYSAEECLQLRFWDWVHDDFKETVRERGLARQRGEEVPSRYECKHVCKDGEEKWVFVSTGLIEYLGKPACIVTGFDMTDRKRMMEELQHAHDGLEKRVEERTAALARTTAALTASEKEKSLILNITDAHVIYYDIDMRILWANRAAGDSLQLHHEELKEQRCWDLWHQRQEACPGCPVLLARDTGEPQEAEIATPDGRSWFIRGYPVKDESGRLIGMVEFTQDFTERKRMEEALRESETQVRRKLASILDPEGDIGELDLADIIDAPGVQALMDDLYRIAGLKMSIIDLKGRVLVDVGWQDICAKFHRANPETLRKCHTSDTELTVGVAPGEFRTYRCLNNMWHLVTPIIVGGKHMGNLFMGQFFFAGEKLDHDLFRSQARKYGFPEEEYIAALEAVPRHSEECVNFGKAVFLRLTDMFSKLSYANIKLARSLSEREQVTATLRQANLVVENSHVVLFRCKATAGWPVELVSRNIVLFGYTQDEFLSGAINYASIIHPDDMARVNAEMEQYVASGVKQLLQEYRILTKDGETRWIIDQTFSEKDERGAITHYEGIIIDVTEHKLAEEQLAQQKRQLEELNSTLEKRIQEEVAKNRELDVIMIQQNRQAALGELLDHIAHQWKQPLNLINLVMYELTNVYEKEPLSKEYLSALVEKITELTQHMAQTIEVFRDFYKPEKEKKVFLLKGPIDQAVSFVAPALRFHAVALDLAVDPEVAAIGYPKEYAQVLLNILGNARDAFRERGTARPRVGIKAFREGGKVVVTITDNAGGIPEAQIDRIFDIYFTTKEASGGTGIGLHMSKSIIENHMGGTLSVKNVEQGVQFRIELDAPGKGALSPDSRGLG